MTTLHGNHTTKNIKDDNNKEISAKKCPLSKLRVSLVLLLLLALMWISVFDISSKHARHQVLLANIELCSKEISKDYIIACLGYEYYLNNITHVEKILNKNIKHKLIKKYKALKPVNRAIYY